MAKKARGRRGGLAGLTTADLQAELARRQQRLGPLQRRREKLMADLEALDAQIAELGGGDEEGAAPAAPAAPARRGPGRPKGSGGRRPVVIPPGRKRPKNDQNLADALVAVLKNKTMSVTEVAEAVQQAGYQTSSANFRTIVNQTLLKDDRIKKVSRGKYTAK